jgi:hypothetical protein
VRRAIFAWLGLFAVVSTSSFALETSAAWGQLGNDFLWSNQKIEGEWKERQDWKGWVCDGFYKYNVQLSADVSKVDFDLTDKGYIIVTAELSNLVAKADGAYRSKATLCLPAGGKLGVAAPWAKLKSEVHFGQSGDMQDISLKILSTEVGRMEMGKLFPTWFEDFFTGVVNRALTVVWNSKMGNWLSAKITETAKKKIPKTTR